MVSLMTEDDEGKSSNKRRSCHFSTALGQEVIWYDANFYPVLLALMTREFSFQLQSCFKRLLWKVWTQELFQKVEFDRPGERSPE